MVGGFATIAGGVMAAYVRFGIDAGHLMAASVMSAPAAVVIAKIMYPETGEPETAAVGAAMFTATGRSLTRSSAALTICHVRVVVRPRTKAQTPKSAQRRISPPLSQDSPSVPINYS
jgi:nucleoside permease NupC